MYFIIVFGRIPGRGASRIVDRIWRDRRTRNGSVYAGNIYAVHRSKSKSTGICKTISALIILVYQIFRVLWPVWYPAWFFRLYSASADRSRLSKIYHRSRTLAWYTTLRICRYKISNYYYNLVLVYLKCTFLYKIYRQYRVL